MSSRYPCQSVTIVMPKIRQKVIVLVISSHQLAIIILKSSSYIVIEISRNKKRLNKLFGTALLRRVVNSYQIFCQKSTDLIQIRALFRATLNGIKKFE